MTILYKKIRIMNENLDIFICTHTQPGRTPTNPVYKIVSQKPIDTTNVPLDVIICEPEKMGVWGKMPRGLSELFNMYYIRHFVEKKEYIGFAQYRFYPIFYNKVPDVAKILEENDIYVHRFFINNVDRLHEQYFDTESYTLYEEILKEYPDYASLFDKYVHQTEFAQRNMFIMKTEDFNKMIDFLFEVLQKYIDRIHCYSDEDLMKRAMDVLEKKQYSAHVKKYQLNPLTLSRFLAYFAEFTISFYIWKNLPKRKTMPIFMTDGRKLDGE